MIKQTYITSFDFVAHPERTTHRNREGTVAVQYLEYTVWCVVNIVDFRGHYKNIYSWFKTSWALKFN